MGTRGILFVTIVVLIISCEAVVAGPMDIYVDCEGENQLDIVFVIDTSSSMTTYSVVDSIIAVCPDIEYILRLWDIQWGVVTFADSVLGSHDFDPTIPGIDLATELTDFEDDIIDIVCYHGGSIPEEDLDALWVAAHCINWRPDAMHVVLLFTDAVFCEVSDSCYDCNSNLTKEECLDTLMNHEIILYPITPNPLRLHHSCVPPPPYHIDFFLHAADTTGGSHWDIDSMWTDSLRNWADSLGETIIGEVAVRNNLLALIDAVLKLKSVSGIELLDTLYDVGTIAVGEDWATEFRFVIDDTATKPAFHVIGDFDGGAYVETLLVTLDSCGCHEAVVELQRGWNMVSLPAEIASVPVWYFPTAIGDAFLYNMFLVDYEMTDILAPGFGYWILSDDSARIMFGGVPIDDYFVPTSRGWNLLGGGSLPFLPGEGITGGSPIWPMFQYNGIDYAPADVIEIGKGYWLLENAAGTWEAP